MLGIMLPEQQNRSYPNKTLEQSCMTSMSSATSRSSSTISSFPISSFKRSLSMRSSMVKNSKNSGIVRQMSNASAAFVKSGTEECSYRISLLTGAESRTDNLQWLKLRILGRNGGTRKMKIYCRNGYMDSSTIFKPNGSNQVYL